jgi:vacuolar-type H+-ATPase subunit I/STV1
MKVTTRTLGTAGLALVGALACQGKPSAALQARIDSLQNASNERDRLVQEMAQDARMISDISAELTKVQVRGKLNVSSESPGQASRDSMVQKVRYIATRLTQNEASLRSSERRVRSLTSLSDSLRNTLSATIANYDSVISGQRTQLIAFAAQLDTLKGENMALTAVNGALKDTVNDLSLRENTVYYIIGTKDELVQRGVVEETGGSRFLFVLWKSGKSLQPARTLDTSAFTAIDKRQVTTIPLPDTTKAYRIASRQDLSSLATPPDANGKLHGTVRIAQPEHFWAASKFLIIVQS